MIIQLLVSFTAAAAIITYSGYHLTRAADDLGERLGWGSTWVGVAILAAVTSMPEVVSSLGGAVWRNQPDLAFGNVFGSNCFNLFIIAILDLVYRGNALSFEFGYAPTFAAALSVFMTGLAGGAVLINQSEVFQSPFVSEYLWGTLLILGYFVSVYLIFHFEKKETAKLNGKRTPEEVLEAAIVGERSLRPILQRLGAAALGVVAAGVWVAYLADEIAVYPFAFGQLGHTFVGTTGLAVAGSLPELVVSLTALHIGKIGMSAGNIFGSNIFNAAILGICQFVYTPIRGASFFETASFSNLLGAWLAVMLSGIAIGGLAFNSKRTMLGMGWDSLLLAVCYAGGIYLLFLAG